MSRASHAMVGEDYSFLRDAASEGARGGGNACDTVRVDSWDCVLLTEPKPTGPAGANASPLGASNDADDGSGFGVRFVEVGEPYKTAEERADARRLRPHDSPSTERHHVLRSVPIGSEDHSLYCVDGSSDIRGYIRRPLEDGGHGSRGKKEEWNE